MSAEREAADSLLERLYSEAERDQRERRRQRRQSILSRLWGLLWS